MSATIAHMPAPRWREAVDAFTLHMRAAGLAERTVLDRRSLLRRAAPVIGLDPWTATHAALEAFLATPGWSAQTRATYRQHLRAFYAWAVDDGRLTADPSARLPRVHVPAGLPHPCPEDALSDALGRGSDRQTLALLLGAYAGLRRSEIAALHTDDVVDGCLRVTGKGGRTRLVPLHARLARRLASVPPGWVFPDGQGGHATGSQVGDWCRYLMPGHSAHELRHRFATRAYRSSHDLLAVQQLLGHASVATTQRYAQLDPDRLAEVVGSIA